jgi:transmembrane sensor
MSGKVRFSGPEDDGIILTAGQSGQLSGGVPVRCEPAGPNPAAWAGGRFRYDATPLGTVLAELSDYYGVRLSVGSGNGEGKCLTGDFSTDSLDEILEIVESVLEVSVVRQ